MRKLVVLLGAAAFLAKQVMALSSVMTNETETFTDKFVTFKDINGGLYQRVQLLSADLDGIIIKDRGTVGSVYYTNISPDQLEALGFSSNQSEIARARAQKASEASAAETRRSTQITIWTTVGFICLVAAFSTVTMVKARREKNRRKWLEQKYDSVVAQNGSLDEAAAEELNTQAICIGFDPSVISELRQKRFNEEVQSVKNRISQSLMMTDDDKAEIEAVGRRHKIKVEFESDLMLCRNIFLIERDNRLPPPMKTDLMLEPAEEVYGAIPSVWQEPRVVSQGYAGTSISIPTGLKGVSFRFGGYSPIRTEQVTALSSGTLYITSDRLLFSGDSRNTSIKVKRIIDGQIYSDGSDSGVRIEKDRGKPDYFSMSVVQARYTLSLIGVMRKDTQREKP